MIRQILFGSRSLALLKGGLDAGAARIRVTAENIAHAETPGYTPREVRFEELLGRARAAGEVPLARSHGAHLTAGSASGEIPRPRIVARAGRDGAEGADIEREMVALQKNEIQFRALSQMLADRYRQLREVIRPS
ncbi:MAG: flagellar basal body rod protein FlgB [Candidatus Eisenbacteria bacterium]|uniref:Flagellar basal body rod protein FlgB n=1 Tax=Eiseniibacteriota bacterium TaxID=2212470 RepID=A0A938BRU4_UNCEI|nr:flagellar basal body rod protein FlgB [Candidatus Eisenbacteria bacterium]